MALREEVILDIRAALRQLDELQSQLSGFNTPITIPVEVRGEEAIADLRRQADAADTTVDIDVDTFGLEQADQTFAELNQEIGETQTELTEAQNRADRLGRELDDVGTQGASAFGQVRAALGPLLATLAAGIGIREIVDQFRQAIDAATALSESINAVNVVFGEGAAVIQAFGEDAAANVGLAASQVNQLVTPIGALLQNFGLEGREAADAALELTTRAADLASVFNTDVNDALLAIGSALRGEQEPIRAFGVNLNAAALDAKALELGLVGVGEEVSQAVRGQAAYAELLEQTAFAAGDFANTADSAANQQRILNAQLEEARAEIGAALIPAFEDLLAVASDLIPTIEDAAPAFGLLASSIGLVVQSVSPVVQLFGEAAGGIGQLAGAISGIDAGPLADLDDALSNIISPAGAVAQAFFDIRDRIGRGYTDSALEGFLERVAERAEEGVDPLRLLEDSIASFEASGADFAPVLESIADAAGLGDEDFRRFVESLVLAQGQLGLTADQVRILRDLLNDLGGGVPTSGGALVGFATDLSEATFALDQFREAQISAFSQTDADRVLRETFGDLPVIVSDLDELQAAAADAGQSVTDFLLNVPEDVTINVDPAVESIGRLLDTLAEVSAVLEETTTAGFGDIEIPELEFDATGAVTNLDEVVDEILSQLGETAAFEANLSELIVDADAVDVAALLTTLDAEVAGALAEAFVLDDSQASELQAALDGSLEGLAPGAAEQLAATLEGAVPEQIAALGVFAADNFVSNQIRGQIAQSASEIAQVLETALDGTVISPALILDLSNVQIQGVIDTGSIGIGDGFTDTPGGGGGTGGGRGGGGGVQPTANFEVNINNPTTQNVETSATQAAQTIQAVASSLVRVD